MQWPQRKNSSSRLRLDFKTKKNYKNQVYLVEIWKTKKKESVEKIAERICSKKKTNWDNKIDYWTKNALNGQ